MFRNLELKNVSVIIEDAIKNKRYEAKIDDADIDMSLTGSKYYITFDEDLFFADLALILRKVIGWKISGYRLNGNLNLIPAAMCFRLKTQRLKYRSAFYY